MRKTIIATTATLALALGLSACGSNADESAADSSTPAAVSAETPSETPTESAPSTPPQDDDDRPLTGKTLKKASAAALKATGEGKVIDSERSDDADHVYEVEVLLDNNEDVTVELDEGYALIRIDR